MQQHCFDAVSRALGIGLWVAVKGVHQRTPFSSRRLSKNSLCGPLLRLSLFLFVCLISSGPGEAASFSFKDILVSDNHKRYITSQSGREDQTKWHLWAALPDSWGNHDFLLICYQQHRLFKQGASLGGGGGGVLIAGFYLLTHREHGTSTPFISSLNTGKLYLSRFLY